MSSIRPFKVNIQEEVLEDLQRRLENTRLPPNEIEDSNWNYGTPLSIVKDFLNYWKTSYDWRKQERELNSFSQYQMEAGEQNLTIHFIYEKSPHPNAVPLLLVHGWPGSVYEFHKIIRKLTHPQEFGGNSENSFHVIAPSIPGYGFSSAPSKKGFNIIEVAKTFDDLMVKLGFTKYVCQGGDWGSMICKNVAMISEGRCTKLHLNFVVTPPPVHPIKHGLGGIFQLLMYFTLPKLVYTEQEIKDISKIMEVARKELGYSQVQGSKPQTLGYGLSDSPIGLLSWILEKFHGWSDCNGDVVAKFSMDVIITNVMIYWVTNTITSSARLYYESLGVGESVMDSLGSIGGYCSVPTGVASFPKEMIRPPKKWATYYYNIQHWSEKERGGHFAALEEPDLLVEDLRHFVFGK